MIYLKKKLKKIKKIEKKLKKTKKTKKKQDKSCNLFKFVSVLLSASVERVGVSRIRDFFLIYLIICATQGRNGKLLMNIQVGIGD